MWKEGTTLFADYSLNHEYNILNSLLFTHPSSFLLNLFFKVYYISNAFKCCLKTLGNTFTFFSAFCKADPWVEVEEEEVMFPNLSLLLSFVFYNP